MKGKVFMCHKCGSVFSNDGAVSSVYCTRHGDEHVQMTLIFPVNNIVEERQAVYGDAWFDAGIVMGVIPHRISNLLVVAPWMLHNWVLILSKLLRATVSPYNKDHWLDIMGYAQLVYDKIEKEDLDDSTPYEEMLARTRSKE